MHECPDREHVPSRSRRGHERISSFSGTFVAAEAYHAHVSKLSGKRPGAQSRPNGAGGGFAAAGKGNRAHQRYAGVVQRKAAPQTADPDKTKPEPSVTGSAGAGKPQEVQAGEAFIKGAGDKLDIDPNDVAQNQLGDCWLLAGLQAVAASNPSAIRNMIQKVSPGKWKVTFHFPKTGGGFKNESVVVDAKVPVYKAGGKPMFAQTGDVKGSKKELWALLIEKAYAKTQGSYAKIKGSKHPQEHRVLEMITGKTQKEIHPNKMTADKVLALFSSAMTAQKGVTLASITKSNANAAAAGTHNPKIVLNHGYSLLAVHSKARTVDLRNPWGPKYDAMGLKIEDVVKFFRRARISG